MLAAKFGKNMNNITVFEEEADLKELDWSLLEPGVKLLKTNRAEL